MAESTPSRSAVQRVSAACRRCRSSKLKCSGGQPCVRCQRRHKECVFDHRDHCNAVLILTKSVSRTSQPLPIAASEPRAVHQAHSVSTVQHSTLTDADHTPSLRSLQVGATTAEGPASYQENRPNKRRRWLYLGVASAVSFVTRTSSMIRTCLPERSRTTEIHLVLDGDAYKISWCRIAPEQQPDLSNLPSIEHATYLMNTVKFHLGGLFKFFDEEEFLQHLNDFYEDAPSKIASHRLWYTQYLLIMAFGTGLVNSSTPTALAGSDYFCRAMSVLPEIPFLHEEPVIGVEVLALVSLYFYCLDMRQTAYTYIAQALRVALVEGNHTNLSGSQLGHSLAKRCTNIWWTVYILDRILSASVGAPPAVSDSYIKDTLPPPQESSQHAVILHLHVKLSRLVSDILTELYAANSSLERLYLVKTRSVLRDMAVVAGTIEDTIDSKFRNSLDTVSKDALHLRLMYHQCIILSIRPLLIALLQEKLKLLSAGSTDQPAVLPLVHDLLKTCADSATKVLRILWASSKQNMLASFLPFDLEFAYSAASLLVVAGDVLRCVDGDASIKDLIDNVLGYMINRGNNAAALRLRSIHELQDFATDLWTNVWSNHETSNSASQPSSTSLTPTGIPSQIGQSSRNDRHQEALHDTRIQTNLGTFPPPVPESILDTPDLALDFDLSQEHMLMIADQLDINALSDNFDFNQYEDQSWYAMN